jgi:peroxiredoxin
MSLQQKLDAFKADFETNKAPPEAVAIMHRATAELIASGQAERALKVGDRAPAFKLADPDGKVWSSAEALAKGPLVVTFYRGGWCPYCNMDLVALEAVAGKVRAAGAALVTISPQTGPNSRKAQRDHDLSFPLLTDAGNEVANSFGLRFRLPEDLIGLYRKFGVDLDRFNGDESWTLPMPARYIIGRDGLIRYAEVNPDYTRRPDPEELIPALARA